MAYPYIYFGAALAWTPADLTGLVAWYDASSAAYTDAGTTLATNGQSVQQWNDRSTNADNLSQATSGNRPVYQAAALNTLPAIRFAVASTQYIASGATAIALGGTTTSVFAVAKIRVASEYSGRLVSFSASGGPDYNTATSFALQRGGGTTQQFSARRVSDLCVTNMTYDAAARFGIIFDGVNCTAYKDNVASSPAASTGTFLSTGRLYVGDEGELASGFEGDISEIVITSTALSSTDRTNLDNYFLGKWFSVTPTLTFITNVDDTTDQTTYTFSSVNIGTASADRLVIVGQAGEWNTSTGVLFVSGSIGGITATNIVSPAVGTARYSGIMQAVVPTGTTANIVVTLNTQMARLSIGVWTLTNYNSVTPTDTHEANESTSGTHAATLDISAGGAAVAFCVLNASTTQAWTNGTERLDVQPEAATGVSGADTTQSSAQVNYVITSTHTSTEGRVVAASWR